MHGRSSYTVSCNSNNDGNDDPNIQKEMYRDLNVNFMIMIFNKSSCSESISCLSSFTRLIEGKVKIYFY